MQTEAAAESASVGRRVAASRTAAQSPIIATWGPTVINGFLFGTIGLLLYHQSNEYSRVVNSAAEKQIAAVDTAAKAQIAAVDTAAKAQIAAVEKQISITNDRFEMLMQKISTKK